MAVEMPLPETVRQAVQIAHQVMDHAIAQRWKRALELAGELADLDEATQGDAVPLAMMLWTDTLKAHVLGGHYPNVRIQPEPGSQMSRTETGERYVLGSAEADMNVEPQILWASALVDARLAGDMDRWEKIYDEAPDDGFGDYVLAVLNITSATIRSCEPGVAIAEGTWSQ